MAQCALHVENNTWPSAHCASRLTHGPAHDMSTTQNDNVLTHSDRVMNAKTCYRCLVTFFLIWYSWMMLTESHLHRSLIMSHPTYDRTARRFLDLEAEVDEEGDEEEDEMTECMFLLNLWLSTFNRI